ncbi:oligoribonuclease [Buchnera aphidicola]|uniref:Oligoribonuclease n=1 Tax=Buchnera aphidicola (Sarucallis kahawaluokalani) TaxID=1241878 RepID=A0A4D6Y9U4_9GAMM|nr:oligoribonuclease [Buchnera aphidicola]QCI26169.1 oligoribonuclease [Buchnera aphidicola (Sarucallis kahawaluokalani)]
MINENHLIWIDLEMTGLNPEKHRILEISTIITNKNIDILAVGPCIPIMQNDKILVSMDQWNTITHKKNNLYYRVQNSNYHEIKAEKEVLNFIKQWVPKKQSPMCGNTISQDRRFLLKYMPKLESYFHYRHIDVSSIQELIKRWYPQIFQKHKKQNQHIALFDIYNAINELKFYKKFFIKKNI